MPSPIRSGRRFGFTVGIAFTVLAMLALWRTHTLLAGALLITGVTLLLGGALVPRHMLAVERRWMQLALLLSRVTTPVLMGAVYYLVLTPTGVARRLVAGSPVRRRSVQESFWESSESQSRDRLQRQF